MNFIKTVYAQVTPHPIGQLCGEDAGLGPFSQFFCKLPTPVVGDITTTTSNAVKTIASLAFLVSNVIGILSVVAGLVFIFQFLIAGFNWLTAGGDKAKLEQAQQKLMNAVVGLAIVLVAYALISLIGNILGFDILLTNPGEFVNRIKPQPQP